MSDDAEKLEEGWYWVRYKAGDWLPAKIGKLGYMYVQLPDWERSKCVDACGAGWQIGPRIQPPQGDEG